VDAYEEYTDRFMRKDSAEVLKYITRVILSEGSAVDVIQILKLGGVAGLSTCINPYPANVENMVSS